MADFLADLETSGLLKDDDVVNQEDGIEAEGAKLAKSPQGMKFYIIQQRGFKVSVTCHGWIMNVCYMKVRFVTFLTFCSQTLLRACKCIWANGMSRF